MAAQFRWPRKGTNQRQAGLRQGFRSGLEEKNAKHLEHLLDGKPCAFEPFKIRYTIPETFHHYTPDFVLPNGIIIETKGRFLSGDRAKHLFVKAQYPELDIRFVFTRAKSPIGPGSKTTLADWAKKQGYKWAEKLVPKEWLDEPGPKVMPQAVLAVGPRVVMLKRTAKR